MVQGAKNPTAAALTPSLHSGLKDLALPQLLLRSQLRLRVNPWPGNFRMLQVQPLKNNENQSEIEVAEGQG